MKTRLLPCAAVFILLGAIWTSSGVDEHRLVTPTEYATVRWGGRDNTHIIRPGGQVEFIGRELRKLQKPNGTDERAFYMNAAMNGLGKEGFELAGMTLDEVVMKRPRSAQR